MSKKITTEQISSLAISNGYDPLFFRAILSVEASGTGFSDTTGKIIIQFEPSWFKRKFPDWKKYNKNTVWLNNGVQDQQKEWQAFNNAWDIDPNAAMQSTSIGMPQIMGFHYKSLGFKTVGEMWDFAKESEYNQIILMIRFLKLNKKLDQAVKSKNEHLVAYYYNGGGYKELAEKLHQLPYDERISRAYLKLKQSA